jgi:hypothetical protein
MACSSHSAASGALARMAWNASSVNRPRFTSTSGSPVTSAGFESIQPSCMPRWQTAISRERMACAHRALPAFAIGSITPAQSATVSAQQARVPIAALISLSWLRHVLAVFVVLAAGILSSRSATVCSAPVSLATSPGFVSATCWFAAIASLRAVASGTRPITRVRPSGWRHTK